MTRSTPEQIREWRTRSKPLRRAPWVRRPSRKAQRFADELRAIRPVIAERCQGRCEFPGCTGLFTDAHHRLRRSQGGDNRPVNIVACCSEHHRWIHSHPAMSYAAGVLVSVNADPARVEILPGLLPASSSSARRAAEAGADGAAA